MESTKHWWQSKTVLVSALTILLGLLGAFKLTSVGPVQTDLVAQESTGIVDLIMELGVMLTGAVAIWGRITAKTTIEK